GWQEELAKLSQETAELTHAVKAIAAERGGFA
ncbi:hypothetical protein MNBD_CHLOROFLEXI01-849, partial [hydrothermal vent metagenome]